MAYYQPRSGSIYMWDPHPKGPSQIYGHFIKVLIFFQENALGIIFYDIISRVKKAYID